MGTVYMFAAEYMTKNHGPKAGRKALIDGGIHYAQQLAASVAPIPAPDVPLVIAAAMTMVRTLSEQFPGAEEMASKVAEDLHRASAMIMMPDPEAIKKWREQLHPPE